MNHRFLAAALSAVIAVGVFSAPVQKYMGACVVAEAATAVAAPKASLEAGSYVTKSSQTIKLSCSTKGAKIYYSLNGGKYKKYSKALKITKNATLKFYAVSGKSKSKVVTNNYNLLAPVTISKEAGTYTCTQTIKLTSTAKSVKFYYTLDGSKPTTKSKVYGKRGLVYKL